MRTTDTTLEPSAIPADFEVRPISPDDSAATDPATCGTCGLTWDDAKPTSWTPAPSGRCPFEYFHKDEDDIEAGERVDHVYEITISVAADENGVSRGPSETEIRDAVYRGVKSIDSPDAVYVQAASL